MASVSSAEVSSELSGWFRLDGGGCVTAKRRLNSAGSLTGADGGSVTAMMGGGGSCTALCISHFETFVETDHQQTSLSHNATMLKCSWHYLKSFIRTQCASHRVGMGGEQLFALLPAAQIYL